jgi:hypothetical protein
MLLLPVFWEDDLHWARLEAWDFDRRFIRDEGAVVLILGEIADRIDKEK